MPILMLIKRLHAAEATCELFTISKAHPSALKCLVYVLTREGERDGGGKREQETCTRIYKP